jgi:Cache 3/Cache 2 fusion domain
MGVGHGRRDVTVVALNLKSVWDAIRQAKVVDSGYAYIVDSQGRLIAHPDFALVLRGTDMKGLPQVAAAFAPTGHDKLIVGSNLAGAEVWSVQAPVKAMDWRVFVELPVAETRAAFWMAMGRAAGLMLLGLAAALVAFRLGTRTADPLRPASA